jgi:ribonuclease P protein component
LHVLANSLELNRAVFVPVRSYRSSVARNRARRLTRECWRLGKVRLVVGFDVAIVLYPGTDSLSERCAQLDRLLGQAGILAGRR